MTVYVDDFRVTARVGRVSARWSHLFVAPDGDLGELHALASQIGLRRSWFQDKPWPRAHYDVTDAKRAAAISAGAVPVSAMEAGRWRATAIDARKAAETPDPAAAQAPPAQRYPVLTVSNPWAWALLHGKNVENRSWKLGYRGPLWLHAGRAWDAAGESSPLVQAAWHQHTAPGAADALLGPEHPLIASGAVIGLLEVTGCHHAGDCADEVSGYLCSPWAVRGQYHIEVTPTAALPSPAPCGGRQKLWALPGVIEQAARAQLRIT